MTHYVSPWNIGLTAQVLTPRDALDIVWQTPGLHRLLDDDAGWARADAMFDAVRDHYLKETRR